MPHPPYSPDLAPSDFHIFGPLKDSLRGTHFEDDESVIHAVKTWLRRELVDVGCEAHIVHNTIQTASDCLPFDIEAVIVKNFSYFYIYTARVDELKEFCKFVSTEYNQLLGYSKTRWLALMPAVQRILVLYPALKSYF